MSDLFVFKFLQVWDSVDFYYKELEFRNIII